MIPETEISYVYMSKQLIYKIYTINPIHKDRYKLLTNIFVEEKISILKRIKNYLFVKLK